MEWNVEDLLLCGERIFNQKRLFNNQCGISRKDDTLPERILKQVRRSGGAADNLPPLDEMLDEYYNYRGWDANGIPLPFKLRELDLV
jgi:aldehyde:ferredoxin oxidoreductase